MGADYNVAEKFVVCWNLWLSYVVNSLAEFVCFRLLT